MTLEKIRASLPTHIMLTPGVHRWREGDEYLSTYESEWVKVVHMSTKILCEMGTLISFRAVRRPIPSRILDNQAFWIWHDQYENNWPLNEMSFEDFRKYITAGRLYDKWLLEQMEDV